MGIPVDHRRKNKSEESLKLNVARIKAYREKVVVLPRRNKKNKGQVSLLFLIFHVRRRADLSLLTSSAEARPQGSGHCPRHCCSLPYPVRYRGRGPTCDHLGGEGGERIQDAPGSSRQAPLRGRPQGSRCQEGGGGEGEEVNARFSRERKEGRGIVVGQRGAGGRAPVAASTASTTTATIMLAACTHAHLALTEHTPVQLCHASMHQKSGTRGSPSYKTLFVFCTGFCKLHRLVIFSLCAVLSRSLVRETSINERHQSMSLREHTLINRPTCLASFDAAQLLGINDRDLCLWSLLHLLNLDRTTELRKGNLEGCSSCSHRLKHWLPQM